MNDLLHLLQPESIVNNTNNNDTYCLRWTRHPHMLADALEINKNEISKVSRKQTTENGPFSDPLMDLTVHLDDGSHIKLHSVVLAAGSDYFQTLGQRLPVTIHLQQYTAPAIQHCNTHPAPRRPC